MQSYITLDDITDLGITLGDDPTTVLQDLNEKVTELVGEEIISALTPNDAEKLADMMDDASDDAIAQWIVGKVPNYPEIIENNIDIVIGDFVEANDTAK